MVVMFLAFFLVQFVNFTRVVVLGITVFVCSVWFFLCNVVTLAFHASLRGYVGEVVVVLLLALLLVHFVTSSHVIVLDITTFMYVNASHLIISSSSSFLPLFLSIPLAFYYSLIFSHVFPFLFSSLWFSSVS